MPNFTSLSCFYSKLRWGAFLPPPSSKIGLKGPLGENTTYMLLLTTILNFLRLTWYPQQALRN